LHLDSFNKLISYSEVERQFLSFWFALCHGARMLTWEVETRLWGTCWGGVGITPLFRYCHCL